MENEPKNESIKLENKNAESVKAYEKNAASLAKDYNSSIENLLGTGQISKEDIIRVDAELENKYFNAANSGEFKSKFDKETLDLLKNSNLRLIKPYEYTGNDVIHDTILMFKKAESGRTLKGKINGQDIEINEFIEKVEEPVHYSYKKKEWFEGKINGKELSKDEAEKIFFDYIKLQIERDEMINDFIKEREKEKEEKEDEKRIESTKNDLEKLYKK